jgi:hypothetical protein
VSAGGEVRAQAIAWLKAHVHNLTIRDISMFLSTVKHEHMPIVLAAWRESGFAGASAIVIGILENMASRQPSSNSDPAWNDADGATAAEAAS